MLERGTRRPVTFCAGYSAADPALQALLAAKGFAASFAAQPVPPAGAGAAYGKCWYRLLEWARHITPLTIPYRVSRATLLPPPHSRAPYLDLVEIPLNMWVDAYDLYLGEGTVDRRDLFDVHYDWARDAKTETAVAIGVHADVIAAEEWPAGPVARVIDRFLAHVTGRIAEGGAEVRFDTAVNIASRFRKNTQIGSVQR